MDEKRKFERKQVVLTTYIRKIMPDGGITLMEFISKDLSKGGIFILTEDLSIFDLGENLNILVDDGGERFYEGVAKAVRSARVFNPEGEQTESGFGLMFTKPDESFNSMVERYLA